MFSNSKNSISFAEIKTKTKRNRKNLELLCNIIEKSREQKKNVLSKEQLDIKLRDDLQFKQIVKDPSVRTIMGYVDSFFDVAK